jgi:hypothetical protein
MLAPMPDDHDHLALRQSGHKQHGDDAWFHASTRADKLLDDGNLDGAATWRRILAAIEELQRMELKAGESPH